MLFDLVQDRNTLEQTPARDISLPTGLFMQRFETTIVDDDPEDEYNDYARNMLTDRGPDKVLFESDAPRVAPGQRSGRLSLQYYGHRGVAEDPAHPEMYYGMDDPDPRGHRVDPDMKKMVKQAQARMRFQAFRPDKSENTTTGGSRAPQRVAKDKQEMNKLWKSRLKIFQRHTETPLRSGPRQRMIIPSTVLQEQQSRFDDIYSLRNDGIPSSGKTRLGGVRVVKDIMTRSAYMNENEHADTLQYAQVCRRAAREGSSKQMRPGNGDSEFASSQNSMTTRRAAAVLMASECQLRKKARQQQGGDEMSFSAEGTANSRKSSNIVSDLRSVLAMMEQETDLTDGTHTAAAHFVGPPKIKNRVLDADYDTVAPSHHYHNAEVIYKTVAVKKTKCDKDLIVADSSNPELTDLNSRALKSASQNRDFIAKNNVEGDTDKSESTNTLNYRTAIKHNTENKFVSTNGEEFKAESIFAQMRANPHMKPKPIQVDGSNTEAKFSDNRYMNRYAAPLGSKFTRNLSLRDDKARENNINGH